MVCLTPFSSALPSGKEKDFKGVEGNKRKGGKARAMGDEKDQTCFKASSKQRASQRKGNVQRNSTLWVY